MKKGENSNHSKFYWFFVILRIKIFDFFSYVQMFLSSRIRLIWSRIYIRRNEFHSSLDIDHRLLLTMNNKQREKYTNDLIRRRNIAHERDLNN